MDLIAAADTISPPASPTRTAATASTEQKTPTTPLSSISTNVRSAPKPLQKHAPRSLSLSFSQENNSQSSGRKRSSSLGRAILTIERKRKFASDEKSTGRAKMSRSSLYRYKKNLEEFKKIKSARTRRMKPGSGCKPVLPPEIENAIIEWMHSRRYRSKKVRGKRIKREALKLANTYRTKYGIKIFTASDGWFRNFKKRHKIRYRRITSLSRKLSDMQLTEYQKEYSRIILSLMNRLQMDSEDIYNMDETPIIFDTPGKYTYDFAGTKSISVETTGNTKNRITLILCISWKGRKVIPFIVFNSKAKKQPFIERYPKDRSKPVLAYYCGQENATNDTKTMVAWIKHVFSTRRNATRACILTMDNVSFHHSQDVTDALRNQNVTVSHFPPNTTCRLQPLDHSINGVIKNKLDEYWNDEFMDQINPPRTKAGNLQRPSKEIMLSWITRAYAELKDESITNSFNSCWMVERKKDLAMAENTPMKVKAVQSAVAEAIAPLPAVTDISDDLLQTTSTTSREQAIPAVYLLRTLPPIPAPLMLAPLVPTPPTPVPDTPVIIDADDDDSDSDYNDNDSNYNGNSDGNDDDDGNSDGDGDRNDGDNDSDGDGDGDDGDGDSGTDGHITNESPPKRAHHSC
jgi:hypothetical protein